MTLPARHYAVSTHWSRMHTKRSRRGWALLVRLASASAALFAFAAIGVATQSAAIQGVAAAPRADEAGPAEPPLEKDMASWRTGRFTAIGHTGGVVHSPTYEPLRSIAWLAVGPRLVAMDVSDVAPGLRPLGRTPALPGPVFRIAVGHQFVLTTDRSERPSAWLIDGRDPAWPRGVRRLELGAPPRAVAADGRNAVVIAGNDIVLLNVENPSAPCIVERRTLPGIEPGARALHAVLDGLRLAVATDDGRVLVVDLGLPEEGAVPAVIEEGQTVEMHLDGDRLFVLNEFGFLFLYRVRPVLTRVWAMARDEDNRIILDFGVAGDALALLKGVGGEASLTLEVRSLAGPEGERREPPLLAPAVAIAQPHPSIPLYISQGLGARSGQPLALLHDGRVETVPVAEISAPRGAGAVPAWEPSATAWAPVADTVIAMARSHDLIAVAGRNGRVDLLDPRHPDAPRLIGTWREEIAGDWAPHVQDLQFVENVLWVALNSRVVALDVRKPESPRPVYSKAVGSGARMIIAGHRVIVFSSHGLYSADGLRPDEGLRLLNRRSLSITALAMHDQQLWAAGHGPTGTSNLYAFDVSGPEIRVNAEHTLGVTIHALASAGRNLVALSSAGDGISPDALQVLDVADWSNVRGLGQLDLAPPAADGRVGIAGTRGALLAWDGSVIVAHPSVGLIEVDLSVPSFPDELGRFPVTAGADTLLRDVGGDVLWVGSVLGGLTALRKTAPEARPVQLWLPIATAWGPAGP